MGRSLGATSLYFYSNFMILFGMGSESSYFHKHNYQIYGENTKLIVKVAFTLFLSTEETQEYFSLI